MTTRVDLDIVIPAAANAVQLSCTALTPVRLTNAADQIAQRLVGAIALGEFAPGDRLPPVPQLASCLQVNATSIREALQRLAAEGYIEIRRGRNGGSFVLDGWRAVAEQASQHVLLSERDALQELIDLRRIIGPAIAATAARRRTNQESAAIEAALRDYAMADRSCATCYAARHALHTAIVSATHNAYLVHLSLQLGAKIRMSCPTDLCLPESRSACLCEHTQIVDAVLKGDAEQAAYLTAQYLTLTEETLQPRLAAPSPTPQAR